MAHGPDYAIHTKLFYASESGVPLNIISGTILYLNKTLHPKYLVLQINNTLAHIVRLWINGSLPSGVTMYFNLTSITWEPPFELNLTPKSSPAVYIDFDVSSSSSNNTDSLFFDYQLAPGINVIYEYPIYVNE